MNAVRSARPRAAMNAAVARLATSSRGRKIVRDPRKAKQRPRASTALEEVREEERAPAPPKFQPFLQQDPAPQSFGSSMLQSMTWGVGMALAFTAVGMMFR
ncbi:unnamed protein product [Ectocarpus sp. 12 AP-2014]